VDSKVPEDSDMKGKWRRRMQETIDKANEQLENFVNILESKNIIVDRPTPIDFSQPIETPDFKTQSMFGCMPPRDVIATVGNDIIEATMSYRCRWFE
jgi:glycine amidinotransferase